MKFEFDSKKFSESKNAKRFLYCIGIALVILTIFQAGVFVGYHKASFSYGHDDNFYRSFGHPHGGMFPGGMHDNFMNENGAAGNIIKITLPTIVVAEDNIEKIVSIGNDTMIRSGALTLKAGDLKVGDFIIVIGSPNTDSQVVAKLIRIVPPPAAETAPDNADTVTLPY